MYNSAKKFIIAVSAAAVCLCPCGVPSMAANSGESSTETTVPMYIAINRVYNNLSLGSWGKLTCDGETEVAAGFNAEVVAELQESTGNGWNTIQTWTAYNPIAASISADYYVAHGTYRLKTTHRAYTSGGTLVEIITRYSNEVTY